MSFILEKAKTYNHDLSLFKELGFEPFETDDKEEIFVGEYKIPDYDSGYVKVWVKCYPAQIWRFEIETVEEEKFMVQAGSGSLSEYWGHIMKVVDGCFIVDRIK